MTNPNYRAMCAELVAAWWVGGNIAGPMNRARALLDHQEPATHYAWELLDAEGDWQAGGSANSLEDVQREGNCYLRAYAQDGPHKLIIQRHCVNTIKEVTNG